MNSAEVIANKISKRASRHTLAAALLIALLPVSLVGQQSSSLSLEAASGRAREVPTNAQLLTLEDVFNLVNARNLSLQIRQQQLVGVEQNVTRARSGLLPSVDLNVQQARRKVANLVAGTSSTSSEFDAKLAARLTLFDAVTLTDYNVSKLDLEVAQLDLESLEQDILETAGILYFTHLRNVAATHVIEANIARDQVLLNLATNQFRAGVATPIDVTRAEVRLAIDERDRLQQETHVLTSETNLKRLLSMDLDRPIVLEPVMPSESALIAGDNITFQSILDARPEYHAAERLLERNRYARKMAPYERAPSLSVFGEYGYASDYGWSGNYEDEWLAGVAITVPIYEGSRIKANIIQADALIRQQEYTLRQLEEQYGTDHRIALQDVRSRFQQIGISRKQVALSEKELELARTRFQQGVADNRDVVEAQANLAAATFQLVESIYNYNLSRVTLARVAGDVRSVLRN